MISVMLWWFYYSVWSIEIHRHTLSLLCIWLKRFVRDGWIQFGVIRVDYCFGLLLSYTFDWISSSFECTVLWLIESELVLWYIVIAVIVSFIPFWMNSVTYTCDWRNFMNPKCYEKQVMYERDFLWFMLKTVMGIACNEIVISGTLSKWNDVCKFVNIFGKGLKFVKP